MSFQGKTALVTGGSGVIGSGVIRVLLDAGATVIAPVRSAKGRASLQKDVDGVPTDTLEIVEVDMADESDAQKLAEQIKGKYSALDYVVASIGAWWQKGPLLEQPLSEVEAELRAKAVAQFLVAKAAIPLLRDSSDSAYIMITGGAGSMLFVPGSGMVTVGNAAAFGISIVLRAETEQNALRLNEVRLSAFVGRHEDAGTPAMPGAPPRTSHRVFGALVAEKLQDTSVKSEVVMIGMKELEAFAAKA